MRSTRAAIIAAAVVAATITGAHAATTGHWAAISELESDAATVSVPDVAGFPAAALVTDAAGRSGRVSGASAWLAAVTDPGETYGSSRDLPYLNLGPAANNADSPSTSTYTFEHPTPADGWMIALGDIDAEFVDIAARDAAGDPVPLADLGFQSTFNYCEGAGTPSCDNSKPQPEPSWDPSTGRLAGPEVDGAGQPIEWTDTEGAAAWFQPSVPLSSITISSTWRAGSPLYQTWFAALSRDISGTVTGSDDCSAEDLAVVLRDGEGTEVDTTNTAADGTWSFADLATYDDWTVTLTPPAGCRTDGDATRTADLSADDAVVDHSLEEIPDPDPDPDPEPDPGDGTDESPTDSSDGDASPDAASSPDTVLPDTGGSSPWTPVLGGLLALAGLVLITVRRPESGRHRA